MARLVLASVFAAAESATLAVTYQDCGAQHAEVTDLQPTSIQWQTSSTETLTGTGTSDEDVTSAYFTATVSQVGVPYSQCSGDASEDIVCKIANGHITVKALSFPLVQGTISVDVEVTSSALILPIVDVHVAADDQNGESLICLDVHTWPAPTPTPPSPTPGSHTITPSSNTNLCLDVPGGDTSNGNQLWLWECNGRESQRWHMDAVQIRYAPDESKCIDAGDMSDGTQLFLWDCNGQDQQKWTANDWAIDGNPVQVYLATPDEFFTDDWATDGKTCLDYYGDWESNGQPLHVWECSGEPNQLWSLWVQESSTLSVV